MNQERMSGVLLHVTSLPSRGGVGDFGPAAYAFVDFLAAAKQRVWQVLPLNPPGYGSSPYSAVSAFAGNPALISLERLAEEGWIAAERVEEWARLEGRGIKTAGLVAAAGRKLPLIEEAARNFLDRAGDAARARFQKFLRGEHELAARVCELQRAAAQVRRCGLEPVAGGVRAAQARRAGGAADREGAGAGGGAGGPVLLRRAVARAAGVLRGARRYKFWAMWRSL